MSRKMAFALACAFALAMSFSVATIVAQQNSEQVVFSGVAFLGSTFERGTPAGFWIWCESDSTNPYLGECQGAMYFYELGLTEHVAGNITEIGADLYRMDVQSADGSISCSLTNSAAPVHGPHNVVDVRCSAPAGHATSPNAVVNVTGP